MPSEEQVMLAYVKLAALSHEKKQMIGRDKFLLLAGASACRDGYPDVAARCRDLVLLNNPLHIIGKAKTFADSLRSRDFQSLLKQLERFCGYERAEHLLSGLGVNNAVPDVLDRTSSGELAMQLLTGETWPA